MSIEKALIAQSGPHILMAKVQAILTAEIAKGCRKELSPDPVALEPQFWPITTARELFSNTLLPPAEVPESVPEEKDLFRLQVWMSPQQKFEWRRAEIFLKMLQKINHRAGW